MSSVGQIHPFVGVIGEPECLIAKRPQGPGRPRLVPNTSSGFCRVSQPSTESCIEQCHDECEERRRVITHIGAGSRTGDSNRTSQSHPLRMPVTLSRLVCHSTASA